MKRLLAVLALLPITAYADTVGLHLYTIHADHQFCNTNPGLYYRWDNGVTVGSYKNSECVSFSTYLAYTFDKQIAPRLDASLTLGAVTGYRIAPVVPMVVPSVGYQVVPGVKARVSIIPDDVDNKLRFRNFHFSVEHQF